MPELCIYLEWFYIADYFNLLLFLLVLMLVSIVIAGMRVWNFVSFMYHILLLLFYNHHTFSAYGSVPLNCHRPTGGTFATIFL